jgi:cytochrome bd-type quinol oxidase subunit 2
LFWDPEGRQKCDNKEPNISLLLLPLKMRHRIDWNFKIAQLNSFITAGSLLAAFSLALFIEFDESNMDMRLKFPYYLATTCSFSFSLAAVIVSVGLTRIIGAPDISNETSQELMLEMKNGERPVAAIGIGCFFLGVQSFVVQFAILALAKIEGNEKWLIFSMAITFSVLVCCFSWYCVRKLQYYVGVVNRDNAAFDVTNEAFGT